MTFHPPHRLFQFFIHTFLAITLILNTSPTLASLPTLGDPTLSSFSTQQEKQLGLAFYRSLRANLEFVDDLQINYYLNMLGNRLVTHSDAAGKQFKFFIIKAPTINAFAGPDAYIGVHSKLIIAAKNESQLAGVLAHEIAHVAQRHLARQFSRSGKSTALTLATLLAAILVGAQDPQSGQAVLLTGLAGNQQSAINNTRKNENEADRVGIGILQRSGINPIGMVQFFKILMAQSPDNAMPYLRDHPLSSARVAEARNRITPKTRNLPTDSIDFEFARARLMVLVSPQPEKYTQNKVVGKSNLGQYKKALALIRTNYAGKAVGVLKKINKQHNNLWIQLALAEAYSASKQDKKALALLKNLSSLYPGLLPVTIAYARSLLANKQAENSIQLLKRQLQQNNPISLHDYAVIYNALAHAYFANGQVSAALEATGNQYAKQGYLELAIQQYNNALLQKNNSASTIKRLKTVKKEIKSQVIRLKEK